MKRVLCGLILACASMASYAGSAAIASVCHMKLLDERVIATYLGSDPGNTKESLIEIAKQQDFNEERLAKVMRLIEEAPGVADLQAWVTEKMQACIAAHH